MAFNPDPFGTQSRANSAARSRGYFDPTYGQMIGNQGQSLALPSNAYKESGVSMADETRMRRAESVRAVAKKAAAKKPASAKPKNITPPATVAALLGLDPSKMASEEFAPQFALLDRLSQQATERYGKAGRDVSGMYAQLADEFRGQESAIKGQYGANAAALKGQLGSATSALTKDMAASRSAIAEQAAKMGVADSYASLANESANQQNQYAGLLQSINQNYQGMNTAQQSSDIGYNRKTAETTDLMGVDARQNFEAMLQNALNEYGNKRLEVTGQEKAAENRYALQNQSNMNDQEKARASALANAANIKQKWDIAQLQYAPKPAGEPNYKNMPADVAMATLAEKLYPNVGDSTRHNAVQAILDTVSRGKEGRDKKWTNVEDFLTDVMARNPNATDYNKLRALGRLYYENIAGGGDKPYG